MTLLKRQKVALRSPHGTLVEDSLYWSEGSLLILRLLGHRNQLSGGESLKQMCPLPLFLQHQAKDLVQPSCLFHEEQFDQIYDIRNCMIEMVFLANQW